MVARVLSKLMIERLMQVYAHSDLPEVIIPIPLHPRRLAERGFNQALELARPISKALRIPLAYRNFLRVRNTVTQTTLTKKYRAKNLKNAFVFKKYQAFNHVALIDDVVTTGCTVNEMSRVLKKAGAKRIDVWCCARTH
jgi:ComF family protein